MTERNDFPYGKFTKLLRFLSVVAKGLRPDLPSPLGQKFQFCLLDLSRKFHLYYTST